MQYRYQNRRWEIKEELSKNLCGEEALIVIRSGVAHLGGVAINPQRAGGCIGMPGHHKPVGQVGVPVQAMV